MAPRHPLPAPPPARPQPPRTAGGFVQLALAVGLVGLTGASVSALSGLRSPPRPVLRAVLALDASETAEPALGCEGLLRSAAELLGDRASDITLTLISSGDRSRGDAPELLLSVRRAPITGGIEDLGREDEGPALLSALQKACAAAPRRKESPLLATLEGALDIVRTSPGEQAGCAAEEVRCVVIFKSDLIEEVDPYLRAALAGQAPTVPLPRLALDGIDRLRLCGTGERQAASAPPVSAVKAAWAPLFEGADTIVTIEPVCAPTPLGVTP